MAVPMEMCDQSMEQYIKKVVLKSVLMEYGEVYVPMDGHQAVPILSVNNQDMYIQVVDSAHLNSASRIQETADYMQANVNMHIFHIEVPLSVEWVPWEFSLSQ